MKEMQLYLIDLTVRVSTATNIQLFFHNSYAFFHNSPLKPQALSSHHVNCHINTSIISQTTNIANGQQISCIQNSNKQTHNLNLAS